MKKWIKEKQLEQGAEEVVPAAAAGARARPGSTSAGADAGATNSAGGGADEEAGAGKGRGKGGKKRGKAQDGDGDAGAGSSVLERERMLASLEGFRRSLVAAGVQLCPEAAAALEGIMIGEQFGGALVVTEEPSFVGTAADASWRHAGSSSGGASMYDGYGSVGLGLTAAGQGSMRDAAAASASLSHDECAHQLVEMLHLLKKTPAIASGSQQSSPEASDWSGGSDIEDSAVGGVGGKRPRSRQGSREFGFDEEDAAESNYGAVGGKSQAISSHLQKLEEIRRKRRGAGSSRAAPSAAAAPAPNGFPSLTISIGSQHSGSKRFNFIFR